MTKTGIFLNDTTQKQSVLSVISGRDVSSYLGRQAPTCGGDRHTWRNIVQAPVAQLSWSWRTGLKTRGVQFEPGWFTVCDSRRHNIRVQQFEL